MPPLPSEVFLIWHEAVIKGQWRKLLRKRLTPNIWIAILLLQEMSAKALSEDDINERAALAIASGWGQ